MKIYTQGCGEHQYVYEEIKICCFSHHRFSDIFCLCNIHKDCPYVIITFMPKKTAMEEIRYEVLVMKNQVD